MAPLQCYSDISKTDLQTPIYLSRIQEKLLHNVLGREDVADYIAFTEKASDSSDPDRDGNISLGLVLGGEAAGTGTLDSHAVIYGTAQSGQAVTTWAGSGWSQGGVASQETWAQEVKDFAYAQAHPLKVTLK